MVGLRVIGRIQAEDGIRDGHVTGVQTCALPIYAKSSACYICKRSEAEIHYSIMDSINAIQSSVILHQSQVRHFFRADKNSIIKGTGKINFLGIRSEERRVGKDGRFTGDRAHSSRRRHTRWPRDWSSDVCSSDLCKIFSMLYL